MNLFGSLKRREKEGSWYHDHQLDVSIDIQDPKMQEKLLMIDLTEQDLIRIKQISLLLDLHLDSLVKDFYRKILQSDELREMIERHTQVARLEKTLQVHLSELFNCQIDEEFLEKRIRVAKVHYQIGLQPAWYMGASKIYRIRYLD